MSLQVKSLLKVYGQQQAVNNISFEVEKGEIVGFLGPNGAGKSTTMKIAAGYLPPTAGQVLVDGVDVSARPLAVKRTIGYLPEHNPLYLELYVHEYLQFIGRLYGLRGKVLRQRVGEMIELCGLTREQHKRLEALSKGYRQRTGLAQALLHNPGVLILDEPTTGLDPNQLVEIRRLIKETSQDKTVIFSTHIMQEVQAVCDRVIVINKGTIVADDRLSNLLSRRSGRQPVLVEFEGTVTEEDLAQLAGVGTVEVLQHGRFKLTPESNADLRPEIFRFAADRNLSLVGLKQEEDTLENIFKELTSKSADE